jgi:hypothetical protein
LATFSLVVLVGMLPWRLDVYIMAGAAQRP